MEQLEKAVAKARAQRGMRPLGRAPGTNLPDSHPLMPVYTQTTVVPFLASALEEHKVVSLGRNAAVSDVYRTLRVQVLQRLGKDQKTTLGITSASTGEGKTLTAVNLAIAMALDVNQTVLLVDLDLRHPSVHTFFGITPKLGINDYLLGGAKLSECLVNPRIDRLVLLPATGSVSNSAELLSSPQMAQLARELKQRFVDRIIIYDLPPLLTVGDTLGFLPNVEATMLVVRDGGTLRADLTRATELLRDHDLIGTVLNAAA
jgi:protein-tyrosine kinase